jgi:hypothetical protein
MADAFSYYKTNLKPFFALGLQRLALSFLEPASNKRIIHFFFLTG